MNNDTILYFDIETASCAPVSLYDDLSKIQRRRWARHNDTRMAGSGLSAEDVFNKTAALYPEYGRVVCIASALNDGEESAGLYSTEKEVLAAFADILATLPRDAKLCGHNIKGFDVPFLRKRYLINNMPVPRLLRVGTLKPWELPYIDTAELWAGGGKRDFSSLELLCDLLDIPQPKTDLTGADVSSLFWDSVDEDELADDINSVEEYLDYVNPIEVAIERIADYCIADVAACRELHRRLMNN